MKPGLSGVLALWATWIAVCSVTWATNARIAVAELYGVGHNGIVPAAGRVVVLLGWPVALAAIPLAAVAAERYLSPAVGWVYLTGLVLSLTVAWPGAQRSSHLEARWINAPAALGVAILFGLTMYALVATGRGDTPSRTRGDAVWISVFAVLLFLSLPWLFANLGFYVGDVPGLRSIFESKQVIPEPGRPGLLAVHLGNHEGIDGVLLAITAVVLMRSLGRMGRTWRRGTLTVYLSVLLVYGLAVALADGWHEQFVKRGWTAWRMPSVLHPSPSWAWLVVLGLSLLVWHAVARSARTPADS